MGFDVQLTQEGVEMDVEYFCWRCKIQMAKDSKDDGVPKYRCPKCGSVYNTAY